MSTFEVKKCGCGYDESGGASATIRQRRDENEKEVASKKNCDYSHAGR